MRKNYFIIILLVAVIVVLLNFNNIRDFIFHGQISRVENIGNFKVDMYVSGGMKHIVISGLISSSAEGAKSLEVTYEGSKMVIDVNTTLARSGIDGNIYMDVILPSNVESVLFGPHRTVIWSAKTGNIGLN